MDLETAKTVVGQLPAENLRAKATEAYALQSGDSLEEQRVLEYLPLVRHIVNKITRQISPNVELDDLISAGTLGLVQAAKSFDPSKEASFKTYAYIRVRGAILDELRGSTFIPSNVYKQIRAVRRTYVKITAQKGSPPSDEELAAKLEISNEQLYRLLEQARRQHFLSIHGLSEEEPVLGTFLPPDDLPSPASQAEHKDMLARLTQVIQQLPERDRMIILLYYERDLTMKEIAKVFEVSESRISQLHASALLKLSMQLGGDT